QEWTLIDYRQEISLLDELTLFKMRRREIAADARADFDRLDRLQPPDVLIPLDDVHLDRSRHTHGWRLSGLRRGVRLGAPARRKTDHADQRPQDESRSR